MADVEEQGERKGLSRRQMIKASAVAGAAAWTAPVIIDSLASPAAAGSVVCPPPGTINTSGAGALYQINGTGTVYFSWIPNGQTTCAATCNVPNDSDVANFTLCGGDVDITNTVVTYNGATPTCQSSPCYFTASASGIILTAAGQAAGVTVLVYLLHNGSFANCPAFGSPAHWAFSCGSTGPCADASNCIKP